ncbi:MAG TPA: hypothetical protein VD929_04855 [Caulobacteraceae bacterium]|nr:hypothetical protein [Caulobacteraceae bacterium]
MSNQANGPGRTDEPASSGLGSTASSTSSAKGYGDSAQQAHGQGSGVGAQNEFDLEEGGPGPQGGQALTGSGGGTKVQAGSPAGGSRSGQEPDEAGGDRGVGDGGRVETSPIPEEGTAGLAFRERPSFDGSGDGGGHASQDSVNNTGAAPGESGGGGARRPDGEADAAGG